MKVFMLLFLLMFAVAPSKGCDLRLLLPFIPFGKAIEAEAAEIGGSAKAGRAFRAS